MTGAKDSGEDYSIQRLTTLSPIIRGQLRSLRRWLAFVDTTPGVSRPLLELSTIHYARWIVLSALPHPDGSGRSWPLNWDYLLFHATYDGPEAEYLNAFTDVLPLRIARLFGTCFGFKSQVENAPGADHRVLPTAAFRDFVQANRIDNRIAERRTFDRRKDPVRAVRQALAIQAAEHRVDGAGSRALGRAQSRIAGLALGAPLIQPGWGEALAGPLLRKARPGASITPLTVVAPLRETPSWPSEEIKLVEDKCTVFASATVIPCDMQASLGHGHPDRLPRNYVLFTSDFYGRRDDYIETIRHEPGLQEIFEHCVAFPGVGRWHFTRWLAAHELKAHYVLCGYPPRPVAEMDALLHQRAQIAFDALACPASSRGLS